MLKLIILTLCFQLHFHDYFWIAEHAKTSRQLAYIYAYFEYDRTPGLQNRVTLCKRMRGDCYDFAVCTYHILSAHGYDCKIYTLYNEDDVEAHSVCTYKKGDDEGYFSNQYRHSGTVHLADLLDEYEFELIYIDEYMFE